VAVGLPGKVIHKGLILIGLPLTFGLLVMSLLLVQSASLEKQAAKAEYYRELTGKGLALSGLSYEIISKYSHYYATRDAGDIERLPALLGEIKSTVQGLESDASKDPLVAQRMEQLLAASRELDERFTDAVSLLSHKKLTLPDAERLYQHKVALTAVTRRFAEGTKRLADFARSQETRSRTAEREKRDFVRTSILASAVVNVALSLGLLAMFVREFRDRLAILVENTKRFSKNSALLDHLHGTDEVTELDGFFHQMAAQVRQARQRETALVDNAVDVICSIDENGFIQAINPAGAARIDQLSDTRLTDYVAPELVPQFQAALQQAGQGREPVKIDLEMHWRNEAVRWCSWSITRVSEPLTFFLVSTDITDRKNLERVRQEFYAMITHDLRTPLLAVLLNVNSLTEGVAGPVSEEVKQIASRTQRSIKRITHLIDDLLDVEKLESGTYELVLGRVELIDIIDEALESVDPLRKKKLITVERDSQAVSVYADRRRIYQVVTNLVSNAIKFSPEGGMIKVGCRAEGGFVEVSVRDFGPGIAPENHSSIFERFRQINRIDKPAGTGTGLGLPICQLIIQQHDGSIGVRSELGKGAEFWFRIPHADI
jgi:PAS domain S-box-containing protein